MMRGGRSKMQVEWSFHKLTRENIREQALTSAGVYLLWNRLLNRNWMCHYVGQARNLRQRLLAHMSDNETNECIREYVSEHTSGFEYAEVGRQEERDGIEKFLYDRYGPKCNKSDPGGTAIEVNLPQARK